MLEYVPFRSVTVDQLVKDHDINPIGVIAAVDLLVEEGKVLREISGGIRVPTTASESIRFGTSGLFPPVSHALPRSLNGLVSSLRISR